MKYDKKVVQVLKSLQMKNGGILATPQDGAYPFIYPRDAVIVTDAFNKLGLCKHSERFYLFLKNNIKIEQYGEVFHRYTKEGLPSVTRQHEHDNTALVVHGIVNTYRCGENRDFIEEMWPFLNHCVEFLFKISKSGLVKTERSIHEFYRLEKGYEIWANSATCRALYDASELATSFNEVVEAKKWKKKADDIRKNIFDKMFNKKLGVFVKNTRFPLAPDISMLSPFYFNICYSKKILRQTMSYLKKHIWHEEIGGFRRFRKFEICKDWHWYSGGSGSWSVFTLWGARFYKDLGDKKNQKLCVDWIKKVVNNSKGLLPEHIATQEEYRLWEENEIEFNERVLKGMRRTKLLSSKTKNGIVYWATPLGWSHAEYVLNLMK